MKRTLLHVPGILARWLHGCLLHIVAGLVLLGSVAEAADPIWWWGNYQKNNQGWSLRNGSVIKADDYAVANVGQLKNFATVAKSMMNAILWSQGGAGGEIATLVDGWNLPDPARDDYAALTAGEAKAVAKKFYDRLVAVYAWPAGSEPWPASPTATTDDHAVINVGQLKNLFSFEILSPDSDLDWDGMKNGFEIRHGLDFRTANGQSDADTDGLTNLMESWLGLDPTADDSDGDGVLDGDEDTDLDGVSNAAELLAGTDPADSLNGAYASMNNANYGVDKQLVLRGALAAVPIKFKIDTDIWNDMTGDFEPWVNLPVVFEVTDGPGTLENEAGSQTGTGKLIAFTDATGHVTVRFRGAALKATSKVRVSLLRLRPSLYTNAWEFVLWTSQCVVDADDDGMDDDWEAAIVAASNGLVASIVDVRPEDDFDGDGVPNVFEFDRGTDAANPAVFPDADVILDHTGTAQGVVPVVQTWAAAVAAAARAAYREHPESRGIIKIMPGSYDTSGWSSKITRSLFLWGQGSVGGGLPELTSTSLYNAIIEADFYNTGRRGVLKVQGVVLDGDGMNDLEAVNFRGAYLPERAIASAAVIENCILRNCPEGGIRASEARVRVDFTTITGCGSAGAYYGNGISLFDSHLVLANSILWDFAAVREVQTYGMCSFGHQNSVIGTNPGITADGRLQWGAHVWNLLAEGAYPPADIDGEQRTPFVVVGADQLSDSDGDGVPDALEVVQGTSAFLADSDGDGVNDLDDPLPLDLTVPAVLGLVSVSGPPVLQLTSPANAVLMP